ncbi:MAG: hypothetical protein JWN31_1635 [Frankiales bacterium]|nr:hypothetical protein [Frankiales bacterium]
MSLSSRLRRDVKPVSALPAGSTGRLRRRAVTRFDAARDAIATGEARERLNLVLRRIGLTRAGGAALAASVLVWLSARIVAGRVMYLLAYGLLLGVITSFFLAPRRVKVDAERTGLFARATAGDTFEVKLTLTALRRLTTMVVEERLPEHVGQTVRVPISRMRTGQVLERTYTVRVRRRGVYQIGPLIAISSDPLGLATRQTQLAEPFELLVHPTLDLLEDRPLSRSLEDPPMRPPISKPWPSGLEFFGLRDYSFGDDLRRINWRASARTGNLMVREAEQGIVDRVVIVLDTNRGGHSRDAEGVSESFEAGVSAAASLGVSFLRAGFEVQIDSNLGPLSRVLRGANQQVPLLDAFARVEMNREPLSTILGRLAVQPPRNSHMVLITPSLSPVEAIQLRQITRTGVSTLVVALLWNEESAGVPAIAAGLGCQVTAVRPGGSVADAIAHEISGAAV